MLHYAVHEHRSRWHIVTTVLEREPHSKRKFLTFRSPWRNQRYWLWTFRRNVQPLVFKDCRVREWSRESIYWPLNVTKKNFQPRSTSMVCKPSISQFSLFFIMNATYVKDLFHQPTLMHNFLYSLIICLLHYYPRHISSINMPIFRRKNCIHTASGIFALCKRLHSWERTAIRSQPVYCADV